MPSGESDVAPLIAEDVALPSRGGFFDLANFLVNPEVRKACEDRDSILVGGGRLWRASDQGCPSYLQR